MRPLPCHAVQPLLQLSVLAVLPQAVRILELDSPCAGFAGPLFAVLERFHGLQELHMRGSCTGCTWNRRCTASVLSRLLKLGMDFRGLDFTGMDFKGQLQVFALPRYMLQALASASRLHSLGLCVRWHEDVRALCCALPALVDLR